jgi:serine-type D-Ala-D-Ala carboxypeptidase (penicillin-binding protein 5/6)
MKRLLSLLLILAFAQPVSPASAKISKKSTWVSAASSALTAQAYAIVDADTGTLLKSKMPHKRLPPASTTKVMTVLVVLKFLPLDYPVTVSKRAAGVAPSKAGLTPGAKYKAVDLVKACLVSSSNDAAVALAEAVGGTESEFANLMNERAKELGMKNTRFVNATGLPEKKAKQYTTAYDLTRLMREAIKNKKIDQMMGLIQTEIRGSDRKVLPLRAHNKMLWKKPKFVKGKTGWTSASRHTFVGTDYAPNKSIAFAMLSSKKPWADIERIASTGNVLARRR